MKMKVSRVDVWAASIEDRPGGLAGKLSVLAKAGANLEFVVARRAPDKPGTGVVFLSPIRGGRRILAAQAAGFSKAEGLHSVRVEGADKPGLGARMTQVLADAGLNLRGLSAAVVRKRVIAYLAFDTNDDAAKAALVLKKMI